MLGIGVWFFVKKKNKGEKDYFLGGKNMNGWVSALSAGASDMSNWVLMGLPGAICVVGLGEVWISIGLVIGTILSWIFVAPRLRRYAIKANDSITVPQFFANRFNEKGNALKIFCAVIFMVGYCLYAASSIVACGTILHTIVPAIDKKVAMIIAAIIIVGYTLMGGFSAVCWTDFFQGMIMLVALMTLPIIGLFVLEGTPVATANPHFYSFFSTGSFDWTSVAGILSGLGWGIGYFGMPHIVVRYMAIKSEKEVKKSRIIGIIWTTLILIMATVVGLLAKEYLGGSITKANKEQVFIVLTRKVFGVGALAIIGGLLLSAIVAAAMSTADSQLLASSSAFSSDIYKQVIKKDASDKEMLWVGRIVVLVITVIALMIALFFEKTSIMSLVSAAWSIFGSAFGAAMLLCLFWKRFNYKGICASVLAGFLTSVLWLVCFNLEYYLSAESLIYNTKLYEIVPGFIVSLIVGIVVALKTKAPSKEVVEIFEQVDNFTEENDAVASAN
jgi:sodium/proline symporter